jgi:hypothetical protein
MPVFVVTILLLYSANKLVQSTYRMSQARRWKHAPKSRVLSVLACVMAIMLCTGSFLYMCAFYATIMSDNFHYSWTEYLFRSLVDSMNLFMLSIDSNIMDDIKSHAVLKGLISAQAVLSGGCTIVLVLSIVFERAKAYFELHALTGISPDRNHLFLFFGMNEPSILLARDIRKREGDKAVIVFVEQTQVREEEENEWQNLIGHFTHRKQTFRVSGSLRARIELADNALRNIELEQLRPQSHGRYDLFTELNLTKTRQLMLQLTHCKEGAQLHLFMMSDDEAGNIRDLEMLAKDATLSQLSDAAVALKLYCHARRNGINRVVEDVAMKNRGWEVRLVDTSHIAVEILKQNPACRPEQVVDFSTDNPITVTSPFHCLIVGFDEVGQDAFKYLYEFSAFVDHASTEDHVLRSPFHFVAIDRQMDQLRGAFEAFTPVVQNHPDIELLQLDYHSPEFFNLLIKRPLNYIVIATGDDEEEMLLAVRILNYLRMQHQDIRKLRIMVRCYKKERAEMLQKIADHYNRGLEKDAEGKAWIDRGIIRLFGLPEEIYCYDMVVNDVLVQQGKQFMSSYNQLQGYQGDWDQRRAKLLGGGLDDLRKLRRQETEDLANAIHAATKISLLRQALPQETDWADFIRRYFTVDNKPNVSGHKKQIRYNGLSDDENRVIRNLAMLEHLRWTASHEMLGYRLPSTPGVLCDECTREHICLAAWEKLDFVSDEASVIKGSNVDYKLFDFATVDNSIWLCRNELLHPKIVKQ